MGEDLQKMIKWSVRLDRRTPEFLEKIHQIKALCEGISGLVYTPTNEFVAAPDKGKFRDFVIIATIEHSDIEALEYAAEEILTDYGWIVDFLPE